MPNVSYTQPFETSLIKRKPGRSLKYLIDLVSGFREKGIEFISLNDSIDTTTAQGWLTFNIFASFAEFERELIRERTLAGLQAARERGRIGGRKKGLSPEAKKTAYVCYQLWEDHSRSVADILKIVGVSKATFYRYIAWVKAVNKNKTIK
jgi:DNA invertase Pin-like site-specific DNA recombinase